MFIDPYYLDESISILGFSNRCFIVIAFCIEIPVRRQSRWRITWRLNWVFTAYVPKFDFQS